ncbi:MAG TPA: hypothetical protein DDX14_08500, partial [Cyanobacteria bacterium UBA9579]|nr:hypothetical protein [Cyanobacteria bacterium UBA9579]
DACKYFLEDCQKNGDNCNITGSDYDLNHYLNLPTSNSTAGRIRIEELGKSFYNIGYPNIVSEIDNTCCNPDFNTACVASGTVSCPWQLSTQLGSVEIPEGMAMDPDGNMYLSGYGNNWALSNYDALITKISPSGTILWMKRVGHSNTTLDELGKKITVDHTGDIYVVGSTDTAGVDDMFVIKMNTNGNVIWQRKIASTYNNDDIGYDVAVDNDKNVYIAGMTHNGSYSNLAILKLNSGGNVEWGKAIGVAGQYADALGITVDTNGDIYAIGRYYTNATNNMDIALIKLNSSGTLLMQKVINSGSNSYDLGTDVKVKNNNIYIAARSVFYGWDFTAIKLDSSGNVTWARRINES